MPIKTAEATTTRRALTANSSLRKTVFSSLRNATKPLSPDFKEQNRKNRNDQNSKQTKKAVIFNLSFELNLPHNPELIKDKQYGISERT